MDLASAEAEIRHVFGDTPITEASIGAAPPDILVKLSGLAPFLRASRLFLAPFFMLFFVPFSLNYNRSGTITSVF